MKKLLSTKYSAGAFNVAILLLRLIFGILMMKIGYDKLIHFSEKAKGFTTILGISPTISLSLVVFAEFFCALFIIIGLFTRFAVIPLIIVMSVALFKVHHGDILGEGAKAAMYLTVYISLLLVGAGRVSVDSMIGK